MAVSIYNISDHTSSIDYFIHDVVKSSSSYYYALTSVPVGVNITNTNYWGGYINYGGVMRPHFLWNPSLSSTVNHTPRIKSISFGEGYEQRIPEDINNNLLDLDLIFELRTYKESFAILHFLYARNGAQSFIWTPPPPYASQKIFVCKEWNHTEIYRDNHSVRARFLERGN